MGVAASSQSPSQTPSPRVQRYKGITSEALTASLIVWASKLGYGALLLTLDEFSLVFGRAIFPDRDALHAEFAVFARAEDDYSTVSALEVFSVMYLVGCLDLGLEDKLDALVALVQFPPLPSPSLQTGGLAHLPAAAKVSRDELFTAVECVVMGLSRVTGGAPPLAMLCSRLVDSLLGIAFTSTATEDDVGSEPARPRASVSQPWTQVRERIDQNATLVAFLQHFVEVTSLTELRAELARAVAEARRLFAEQTLALQTVRGSSRRGGGLGAAAGFPPQPLLPLALPLSKPSLGLGQSTSSSSSAAATRQPPMLMLSLTVSLSQGQGLLSTLCASRGWPLSLVETAELPELLLRVCPAESGQRLGEAQFEALARAVVAHALLRSKTGTGAGVGVPEQRLGTLVRLLHSDEAGVPAALAQLTPALVPVPVPVPVSQSGNAAHNIESRAAQRPAGSPRSGSAFARPAVVAISGPASLRPQLALPRLALLRQVVSDLAAARSASTSSTSAGVASSSSSSSSSDDLAAAGNEQTLQRCRRLASEDGILPRAALGPLLKEGLRASTRQNRASMRQTARELFDTHVDFATQLLERELFEAVAAAQGKGLESSSSLRVSDLRPFLPKVGEICARLDAYSAALLAAE